MLVYTIDKNTSAECRRRGRKSWNKNKTLWFVFEAQLAGRSTPNIRYKNDQ